VMIIITWGEKFRLCRAVPSSPPYGGSGRAGRERGKKNKEHGNI